MWAPSKHSSSRYHPPTSSLPPSPNSPTTSHADRSQDDSNLNEPPPPRTGPQLSHIKVMQYQQTLEEKSFQESSSQKSVAQLSSFPVPGEIPRHVRVKHLERNIRMRALEFKGPLLEVPPLRDSMTCLTGQRCHNNGSEYDSPVGHTIMTHLARTCYRGIIALTLLFHHPASLAHTSGSTLCGAICCPTVARSHNHLPLPLDGHQSASFHRVDPLGRSRPAA